MGAIGSTLVTLLNPGDHIVCGDTVHGGTSVLMSTGLAQMGIEVTFVDTSDLENLRKSTKASLACQLKRIFVFLNISLQTETYLSLEIFRKYRQYE